MSNVGNFFSMPVEMANEIVLQGGHAEEVITALVLCRGAGRHSSTAWTENSVITNVHIPSGKAKKAIHWLAERKFIGIINPQANSDMQQFGQTLQEQTLQEETLQEEISQKEISQKETSQKETSQKETSQKETSQKENDPKKVSSSKKKWKVHTSQYASTTYFPNVLIDRADDKSYGPIGKLYNEFEIKPVFGIKAREAQLDLIMLLLHLHAEQDISAYGGVAPQAWHCTWLPVSEGMGRACSDAINPVPNSDAVIYEIERGEEHLSAEFITKALFYVAEEGEREKRFKFALKNLKKLNFLYELLTVWIGNPLEDATAEIAYPLYVFERQARNNDEPTLLGKVNDLADKLYADRDGEPGFERDGSLKNVRPGNFRYFGYWDTGCVALSVKRMRFRAHCRDTGIGMAMQAKAVEDWTALIEEIHEPSHD